MNLLVVEVLFVLCLTSGCVRGENHFVCKQINEIFSPTSSVPSNVRHAQGRPGKKGNKGEVGGIGGIGPKGSKGEVGEVNYDAINVTMKTIADKLEKIQEEQGREILSLKNSLSKTDQVVKRLCPIYYNRKCFIPVLDVSATLDRAREVCVSMEGDLANIYGSTHFNMIMNHIRSNVLNGRSDLYFRLGMTYNPTTSQVFLTNGSKAPYLKWYTGYPESQRKSSSYTTIILKVYKDEANKYQHLLTASPTSFYNIICEI